MPTFAGLQGWLSPFIWAGMQPAFAVLQCCAGGISRRQAVLLLHACRSGGPLASNMSWAQCGGISETKVMLSLSLGIGSRTSFPLQKEEAASQQQELDRVEKAYENLKRQEQQLEESLSHISEEVKGMAPPTSLPAAVQIKHINFVMRRPPHHARAYLSRSGRRRDTEVRQRRHVD